MTIFSGSVVSLLGSALQAGSTSMAMLIAGRFIGGVAVGMLTSTIPMYASEISTPKWRGALSGLLQWFLSWGFLVAQWLGYGCSFSQTDFSCSSRQPGGCFHHVSLTIRRAIPPRLPVRPCPDPRDRYLVPERVASMAHGEG